MVFFHCELCNHNCRSMQTFTKHISSKKHKELAEQYNNQQKIKTLQIKKYNCIYCNKEYIRPKKHSEHQLKCSANTSLIQKDNTSSQLVQLPQFVTNNINNINNINLTQNNNTTNNNYFIMPFGKEDLSMISDDKRKYIISRGFSAYSILLDEVYKHPQNNNVHFYDKRNQLVRYLDSNNNIRITKFKDAIEDIVYTNFDRIDEFLEEHIDSLSEKERKYATKLLDAHSNESKKLEKLKEYNIISECKMNEIAPQCKKNFAKLAQINDDCVTHKPLSS